MFSKIVLMVLMVLVSLAVVVDAQNANPISSVTVDSSFSGVRVVSVYSTNGTLLYYQYSSQNQFVFSLKNDEYIVTAQVYAESYNPEYRSYYAYAVSKSPFDLTLKPLKLTSYGCRTLTVNTKFVNGTTVNSTWIYAYPLGVYYYDYSCSYYSGSSTLSVLNVPLMVYAYYYYPVDLPSGLINTTVNAGGLRVNVSVSYWPQYVTLMGKAVVLPNESSVTLTLNQTQNYYVYPFIQTGVSNIFPFNTGTGAQLGEIPTPPQLGGVSSTQIMTTPSLKVPSQSSGITLPLLTTLLGAILVACVGYIVTKKRFNLSEQ
jgi:hypothetical protein